MKNVCPPGDKQIVCPPGDKQKGTHLLTLRFIYIDKDSVNIELSDLLNENIEIRLEEYTKK